MKVLKFGGAAFTSPSDFHNVATIVNSFLEPVVVVVSAMYQVTNELTSLAEAVNPDPPKRELDMLLSVGERVSMSLLAMALPGAVSFTGSQAGIITTADHSGAQIVDVTPRRVEEALAAGRHVIVAGFQGVSRCREITTLGRGGSDTTAVALGVALGATEVLFYKDVGAVFTADPKKDTTARPIAQLSYGEALLLVQTGHAVIHPRALLLAQKNSLPLQVRSFTTPQVGGTVIGDHDCSCRQRLYETCPGAHP